MSRLFLGAVLIGFAAIFVKLVGTGPTTTGFYRCAFAAIFLGGFISSRWFKSKVPMSPLCWPAEAQRLTILAGVLFALDLFVWHRSIIYAGAGMATILGNTQVFYVSIVGIIYFQERLTLRFILAVLTAFLGLYLLINYRIGTAIEPYYWWGVGFGLATGLFYSSFILTLRRIESLALGIPTEHVVAVSSVVSALTLFFVALCEGSLRLPQAMEWVWLPCLALVAQVFGWVLIMRSLPKIPASRASLILLMQTVVAVVVGNLLFDEQLSGLQMAGALITLFSIYLGTLRSKPAPLPSPA